MHPGKQIRLSQFLSPERRSFILAVDTTIPRGIHPAFRDPLALLERAVHWECDALLLHSGLVKAGSHLLGRKPFLIKLTTATRYAADKTRRVLIDSVEHAMTFGACGVAMNCFIGSAFEPQLLEQLGGVAEQCDRWGLPLIAMINPMEQHQFDPEQLTYVSRVGAELGADVIKTDYTGAPNSFRSVVDSCPVPVMVEESLLPETAEGTLRTAREVVGAGGAGVMFAHRVWAHPQPDELASQIHAAVHSQVG